MQPDIPTKSSIMIGLGETKEEIIEVMDDLLANNASQWLKPFCIAISFSSANSSG
jgi:lipoate synthase